MKETLLGNPPSYECDPIPCDEEYREPKWMSENLSTKLW
jgi:hypothetical protein